MVNLSFRSCTLQVVANSGDSSSLHFQNSLQIFCKMSSLPVPILVISDVKWYVIYSTVRICEYLLSLKSSTLLKVNEHLYLTKYIEGHSFWNICIQNINKIIYVQQLTLVLDRVGFSEMSNDLLVSHNFRETNCGKITTDLCFQSRNRFTLFCFQSNLKQYPQALTMRENLTEERPHEIP